MRIVAVEIKSVRKWSKLYFKGIRSGDRLVAVNGNNIRDFLDYEFYIRDTELKLEFDCNGKSRFVSVKKKPEDGLGLEFGSYLMDKQQRCRNNCIFCFIDQNPAGMRESIYFKDDDSRLSFLFGNYITLTNLTDEDIDRIIKMHISPVNISVHTMNKELRVQMMKNKNAGKCLDYISRLADAGIEINTQLVLCPGINDGKELEYSLNELAKLYPAVQSIAAVPVGVTKHREGLFEMPVYTKESSAEVIGIINEFGDAFKEKHGTRLAYASDEFYLKAEKDIPESDYYEDYSQIENGVGMWRDFIEESVSCLDEISVDRNICRSVSVATGTAAYPLIKAITDKITALYPSVRINVYKIKNDFYGHTVTVAGLVTGNDLISQLKGNELFGELLIPDVMLNADGELFLDNVSLKDVENELNVRVNVVSESSGSSLIDKILNVNLN